MGDPLDKESRAKLTCIRTQPGSFLKSIEEFQLRKNRLTINRPNASFGGSEMRKELKLMLFAISAGYGSTFEIDGDGRKTYFIEIFHEIPALVGFRRPLSHTKHNKAIVQHGPGTVAE
ncbi:hypothetical protein J6590_096886 [Homalodisca vitripennis]|nr:hypothetical protein J6590_096886 [Homalodisca vitripennis]